MNLHRLFRISCLWFPLYSFMYYYVFKKIEKGYSEFKNYYYLFDLVVSLMFLSLCLLVSLKFDMMDVGIYWKTGAFYIWVTTFICSYIIVSYNLSNKLDAFYISIQLVFSASWIYELTYFIDEMMFYRSDYPLFLNTQIISTVLFFYFILKNGFKFDSPNIISIISYLIVELFMYLNDIQLIIIRIPTALLLIMFVSKVKRE